MLATRLIPILVLVCCATFVFGQELFQRECPVGDESPEVEVQEVLNLKQRCYEVSFETQKGYLCVWARGTPESQFIYTVGAFDSEKVTEQGWIGGGNVVGTVDDGFNRLCAWVVRNHRREQARTEFNPNAATEELDEFFKSESQTAADGD